MDPRDSGPPDTDSVDTNFDVPDGSDAVLCVETSGIWDEGACGHYHCGIPNSCEALIPGCNCGTDSTFEPGRGCVLDLSCEATDFNALLCSRTGGTWHLVLWKLRVWPAPTSVRPWLPGCDCGPGANFNTREGCVADPRYPGR